MGLFNLLFKKPFHRNINDEERREWFSKTKPWNKVDRKIIDALIEKFGDSPMFEVFVITSVEQGLVQRYEDLSSRGLDEDQEIVCLVISGILVKTGVAPSSAFDYMLNSGKISGKLNKKKLSRLGNTALNLLEPAIILDANQVGAYVMLANLTGLLNRNEEALRYAQQGLSAIHSIREAGTPFHMSSIEEIKNAPQHLDDSEQLLIAIKRNFAS